MKLKIEYKKERENKTDRTTEGKNIVKREKERGERKVVILKVRRR